jgi:hypothetical protein
VNQSEVERAVARATGESRRLIRRYGFSLMPNEVEPSSDLAIALDCPGCGSGLNAGSASTALGEIECSRCDAIYPYARDELYVADQPPRTQVPAVA